MDDDALRTHHVIAAVLIGVGFAALGVVASPVRRLRAAAAARASLAGGQPALGQRVLRRTDPS